MQGVGCADEGGASFANDGLRKLSPSYGPLQQNQVSQFLIDTQPFNVCGFVAQKHLNMPNLTFPAPNPNYLGRMPIQKAALMKIGVFAY